MRPSPPSPPSPTAPTLSKTFLTLMFCVGVSASVCAPTTSAQTLDTTKLQAPVKTPSNILGQFTRLVLSSTDVIRSISWWSRLGFTPSHSKSERPDSAMTMTDGQIFITLVKTAQPSPAIMFRAANMLRVGDTLTALAVPYIGDVKGPTLGEIRLKSPNAVYLAVRPQTDEPLLPPTGELNPVCGRITELSIGTGHLKVEASFWDMLGFVKARSDKKPYAFAVMTDARVQVGLHEERDIPTLALTYFSKDMAERIDRLKKSGMPITEELPSSDGHLGNIILKSPDGQLVYMFEGDQ